MNLPACVYHLAEAANWASIQRYGLLSARNLVEFAGLRGAACERVETQHRPERTVLPNGVVVRDQKPMSPAALERCLVGMTPGQWYALLNTKVFFWFDTERLNRQRRACGAYPQISLIIDTKKLLERYADAAAVTPINTGNARRRPTLRASETFVPYPMWLKSAWSSEAQALGTRTRPRNHPPVELAVADSVPDVLDFVLDVRHLAPGDCLMPYRP
ncbi:MAG: DUF7002 family protein [Burkholderiales bacterium]